MMGKTDSHWGAANAVLFTLLLGAIAWSAIELRSLRTEIVKQGQGIVQNMMVLTELRVVAWTRSDQQDWVDKRFGPLRDEVKIHLNEGKQ